MDKQSFISWTENILKKHSALEILNEPVFVDILKTLAEMDAKELIGIAVYMKATYHTNSSIVALAILRAYNKKLFKESFHMVIWNVEDLITFIHVNKALGYGLGKSVKKVIAKWLEDNISEDMAIAYRDELAEILLMIHMKSTDPIFDYIVAVKKEVYHEKIKMAYRQYPKIEAFEVAKYFAQEGKVADALQIAKAYDISTELIFSKGEVMKSA